MMCEALLARNWPRGPLHFTVSSASSMHHQFLTGILLSLCNYVYTRLPK